METMSSLSVVNLLPSKKAEVETFAAKLITAVEEGNEKALDLWIKINAISKSFETVKDAIKEYAMSEAATFSAPKFEYIGSEVTVGSVKTEYDFTKCGDSVWQEAFNEEEAWKQKRKDRETFLKTIKGSLNIVNDDGEGVTIHEPIKKVTDGLKISLR